MPSATARRLCPDLVFVRPRFDAYKAVSNQIRAIFADYTDAIEPLSLDEAFIDISGTAHLFGTPAEVEAFERTRRWPYASVRASSSSTLSATPSCASCACASPGTCSSACSPTRP